MDVTLTEAAMQKKRCYKSDQDHETMLIECKTQIANKNSKIYDTIQICYISIFGRDVDKMSTMVSAQMKKAESMNRLAILLIQKQEP